MAVDFFGIQVDADWRGRLATAPGNPPGEIIPLSQKVGTVVHYAGGTQNRSLGALTLWQSYARNHISMGRFARGVIANGLMYHLGVSDDGLKAGLFDPRVTRWHAGSGTHNRSWVAINIPIGGHQDATYAQKVGMEELLHDLWKLGVGGRQQVIGHREASSTSCPGVLQRSFVEEIRGGHVFMQPMQPKEPIPEDHVVFDVPGYGTFWIIQNMYQRWARESEPLFQFGWPISGMRGSEDSGYIQWFERARMEWRPDSWPDRYDVQLGLIGLELAHIRYPDWTRDAAGPFEPMGAHEPEAHRLYFPETGFSIAYGMKSFWEDWGGLEFFGLPISREFQENGRTVQYFERARLEHHPDSTWDPIYHQVSIGRVGAELLRLQTETPPAEPMPAPGKARAVSLDSYIPVADPHDVIVDQMIAVCYEQGRQPVYDAEKIQTIAQSVHTRSGEFGFRTSLVWAQMCHETGFFRFGGQVKPGQNNYAGLGADNSGAAGAVFASEDEGVIAVLCHLALYVYGDISEWPAHLQPYGPQAIRRRRVIEAHETVRLPDGTRLGFLGAVTRVRDLVNGRWARTDALPLGTLENGYAYGIIRSANETIQL